MNYGDYNMTHLKDAEFVSQFNEMFKPVEWKSIEGKLFSALSKTFRAAVLRF
jgi:hypothetical protein